MSTAKFVLGVDFSDLNSMVNAADQAAKKIREGFATQIGRTMFDGIFQALHSIPEAMGEVLKMGGELADVMDATGASGGKMLVLQRAFELTGQSADSAQTSLHRMQKALAGVNEDGEPTNKVFAQLGLSIESLKAQDPTDAFITIGSAISKLSDPAQRTAAAMGIFGKTGAKLNTRWLFPC